MYKNNQQLVNVLAKVGETRTKEELIKIIVYTLDEVLSLSDFTLLIDAFKDEVEE